MEGADKEAYFSTVSELAELGSGAHASNESIMDKLIYTHIVRPAVRLETQPGARLDAAPNTRGDLQELEIAIAIQNAKFVKEAFVAANPEESLSALSDTASFQRINNWLAENPVHVWVSRSPIPHKGGAYMARVIRLHGRKGLVEVNVKDGFGRLEFDFDGDEIHIEKFTPALEEALLRWQDAQPKVKGIDLNKHVYVDFLRHEPL